MNENVEYLRKRFAETVFKSDNPTIMDAVEKAYADMSRRATGHKPIIKETCALWLTEEVFDKKFFNRIFCNQDDFNNWHKETSEAFVEKFNSVAKSSIKGTYGRAQKVINMSLKYLSCIPNISESILKHSKYYHMTLDGYTLNWYKRTIDKSFKNEWSKIESYAEYSSIQTKIRNHLTEENRFYEINVSKLPKIKSVLLPKNPFDAEFIIWEGEIVASKYDNLIKEIDKYYCKNKTDSWREKDKWLIDDGFNDYLQRIVKGKQ